MGDVLHIKCWAECEELPLRNSHDQIESLRVKIRYKSNKGHLVFGLYYRSPNKVEPVDQVFLLQLQEALHSQALILMGTSTPHVCWERNTVDYSLVDSWSVLSTTFWSRY